MLPENMENELVPYCLDMERRFFEIKIDDLRRLAYELAEANGIEHRLKCWLDGNGTMGS